MASSWLNSSSSFAGGLAFAPVFVRVFASTECRMHLFSPPDHSFVTDYRPSDSFRPRSIVRVVKEHLLLLFGLLGVMWSVEILDLLPLVQLDRHGIHPREVSGLLGIAAAPFLHADFAHLMLNSVPFVVLGGTVLLSGVRVFWGVTIFVVLLGGFGVWLLAPKFTNHIGASGLIFGYLGFLLARGVFEKSFSSVLIALGILVGYGGLIWGVLPGQDGVSWQGHLFGFFSGAAAARLMAWTN
jgi:membrane associated rhomboid family serine protease